MIRRTTSQSETFDGVAGIIAPGRLIAFSLPSIIALSVYMATSSPVGSTKEPVLKARESEEKSQIAPPTAKQIPVAPHKLPPKGLQFYAALSRPNKLPSQALPVAAPTGKLQKLPAPELPLTTQALVPSASPQISRLGYQVSINGRTLPATWSQWRLGESVRTGISDAGMSQTLGVELLNTGDVTRQPVQWFSQPATEPLMLATQAVGSYRYLDITDFAQRAGWKMEVKGTKLLISSKPAQVADIQPALQPRGSRMTIEIDRPTPWQVRKEGEELVVTMDAVATPALLQRFSSAPVPLLQAPKQGKVAEKDRETEGEIPSIVPLPHRSKLPTPVVESIQNQTQIRINIPAGLSPRFSSLPNPNRLVIDFLPEAMVERDILWAKGIRWKQQYVSLGSSRFPVVGLILNPRLQGDVNLPFFKMKPIWSHPSKMMGVAPLSETAQMWHASAAVNGGFFNRKNQLPLGAIRRDGRWLSGPILNRGAIAWNDTGAVKIGRLALQETLITSTSARLPIFFLNSGYVKAGISRYTPEWGATYTPLIDDEIIVVVQNNQVTSLLPGGIAGKTAFPIPRNGFLLTLRANRGPAASLPLGTKVWVEGATVPADFNRYPHIVGAGPLLLQNRQIVLNAKGEQFSDAFDKQAAIRSAIGTTADGNLMIVAVHNRVGGTGPTLREMAALMQKMGIIDALNLDGGSSTSLYLGGQLLDRPPSSAARVHNGLGIFFQPTR
ncbi:phosphodiester glycosidase family protein [Coleofasciculus sp. FACHB-SPT36]|uniref:phosphodiester glycosidase family protein n=1 Tax=Cyanophyceae TaxID=3028117 RepID=UPI001F54BD37|nr:phosphodiester glycosidase family protein [Coleofasciculus sp. FACHB-SPT36]